MHEVRQRLARGPQLGEHGAVGREVARAVLSVEPMRENKRDLLKGLQAEGVFLIDAVAEPVEGPCTIEIGRLIARVRRLQPEKVIIIKSGVYDRIAVPLRKAGIPVVPIRIPSWIGAAGQVPGGFQASAALPSTDGQEGLSVALKYGYELKDWQAAKDEIVQILGARVRAGGGPITYGELCSSMKSIDIEPHSYALAHMLGEVSDDRGI